MKAIKLIAALAALAAIAPAQTLRAEAQQPPRWLVAQNATCDLDGRRVPVGTRYCREGYTWVCGGGGNWNNTNKPC
jgi:hypothetical protein